MTSVWLWSSDTLSKISSPRVSMQLTFQKELSFAAFSLPALHNTLILSSFFPDWYHMPDIFEKMLIATGNLLLRFSLSPPRSSYCQLTFVFLESGLLSVHQIWENLPFFGWKHFGFLWLPWLGCYAHGYPPKLDGTFPNLHNCILSVQQQTEQGIQKRRVNRQLICCLVYSCPSCCYSNADSLIWKLQWF